MKFNLSLLAVREKSITLFFILMALIGGVWAFLSMGRAEDPTFTIRVLVVNAYWPGATNQEMEQLVVNRLEKRLQEVRLINRIDVQVSPGAANLIVEFKDYTPSHEVPDLFYQVRKRMQEEASHLPKGVIGPIVNDSFSDVYFTLYALSAPGLPFRDLSRTAEGFRDQLAAIPGVEKAMLIADRPERVFIEFDRERLAALALPFTEVEQQLQRQTQLLPSGQLQTSAQSIAVRLDSRINDLQQLRDIRLHWQGQTLRLQDVAEIRRGYEDPATMLARNDGQDAVLLGVVMQRGFNGLELGKQIDQWYQQQLHKLPLGMSLHRLTNQAEAITAAVELFQVKFLVAVIVVMAVSILAIGLRAGLIVGIAVPLTLGLTFLTMRALDINLDRITLGALIISLGLLVDDAIIAIEMMMVKLEEGMDRIKAAGFAWTATAAPMLFGTLVTISGFVPIGFAKSGVGEYTGNIFWVVGFALIISWIVAVTFTPYLGTKMLPKLSGHQIDVYRSPIYLKFRRLVQWCIAHKRQVIMGTAGLFIFSAFLMAKVVQKQFFPTSDRPEVLISVYLPHGSSIQNTDKTTRKIEKILHGNADVKSLSAFVGAGAPRFFISANPEQPNTGFAKVLVVANDDEARDRLITLLQQHVAAGEFPEARVRVTRLLYGPPVAWPVAFRVLGPDNTVVRDIANQVRQVMSKDPAIVDAHLEWDEMAPSYHMALSPEKLSAFGLTSADVALQLQLQLTGYEVTQLREDIREVPVIVRLQPDSFNAIDQLEIKTATGQVVSLQQLSGPDIKFEEPFIRRLNRRTYLAVSADVEGAQPNFVTDRLWEQLADIRAKLPAGYSIEKGGSVEESGKADASINKLMPLMIGLMLIFIMLQMRSFIGTLMVLATAPLGLIGAAFALLLFNQPFGFVALLGLIGLAGILMRNTLILTQQVSDNLKQGLSPKQAVVEATVRRARPVILTALAAMLAFIPLTFDTFWGPLAFVLIGGIGMGTALTLLFVPALYMALFKRTLPKEADDVPAI